MDNIGDGGCNKKEPDVVDQRFFEIRERQSELVGIIKSAVIAIKAKKDFILGEEPTYKKEKEKDIVDACGWLDNITVMQREMFDDISELRDIINKL